MDLEKFEADVRAALATGEYLLAPRSYGGWRDERGRVCGCLVTVAALHASPHAACPADYQNELCRVYGATGWEVMALIDGFDYPHLHAGGGDTPSALAARLNRELLPLYGGHSPP